MNGIKSYDLCVIKTVRKIEYKDQIRPICLADTMPEDGTILYTGGWPSKNGGAKKPAKIIMEEVLSLKSDLECRADHFGKVEFDQRCAQKPKTRDRNYNIKSKIWYL